MPTVLRLGPYRFYFYASDRREPSHVHVERDDKVAKFWLEPVRLERSGGFSRREIRRIQEMVGQNVEAFLRVGMSTLKAQVTEARAQNVKVTIDTLSVDLTDGRTIAVPLAWFPRLLHASAAERNNWRFIAKGEGIHWSDLDEDISVDGLLLGRQSGESNASLEKWLQSRESKRTSHRKTLNKGMQPTAQKPRRG
jgi:Protein of unknown function (DUF2442)/Domain of unknown function (DUF4160)